MAHSDALSWNAPSDLATSRASVDDLIRPGLRCAYPLPKADHAKVERFRRLLDALARRRDDGR
ncbi:hypothetical protein J2Z33_003537 [Rubellimicrobium aerolatum]|nr:hypothetical protein [Rubellimicrobium aerolatum]